MRYAHANIRLVAGHRTAERRPETDCSRSSLQAQRLVIRTRRGLFFWLKRTLCKHALRIEEETDFPTKSWLLFETGVSDPNSPRIPRPTARILRRTRRRFCCCTVRKACMPQVRVD